MPSADAPNEARRRRLEARRHPSTEYRRVLPFALLVSVAVHFLAFTLPLVHTGEGRKGPDAGPATTRPLDGTMQVLRLREPLTPEPMPPDWPRGTSAPPADVTPEASAPPRGDLPADTNERDVPASLRPAPRDSRLWRPVIPGEPDAVPRTDALRARIDALNERLLRIRNLPAGDMSDWVAQDVTGERWGLSPGLVHLGVVAVPLCSGSFDASNCGFGVPPLFRDRYRARLQALIGVQRQGQRARLLDRAQVIRAQMDSLRDSVPPKRH